MSSIQLYAITARVCTVSDAPGTKWESVREVPTFYLHPNVQGIVSTDHAERIATEILGDRGGRVVYVSAVLVDVDVPETPRDLPTCPNGGSCPTCHLPADCPKLAEEPDREPSAEQEAGWDIREDDARGHALDDDAPCCAAVVTSGDPGMHEPGCYAEKLSAAASVAASLGDDVGEWEV